MYALTCEFTYKFCLFFFPRLSEETRSRRR